MRVLRIENKAGKGYLAALPSGESILKEFYKKYVTMEAVSCFIGGKFPLHDGCVIGGHNPMAVLYLTEIQIIQLYFLSTMYKPDECFYSAFYDDSSRYTSEGNRVVTYNLFNDFEFLEILNKKGFKLYYANIPPEFEDDIIRANVSEPSVIRYQCIVRKGIFQMFKKEYEPEEKIVTTFFRPFEYFKHHFCGEGKGVSYLVQV